MNSLQQAGQRCRVDRHQESRAIFEKENTSLHLCHTYHIRLSQDLITIATSYASLERSRGPARPYTVIHRNIFNHLYLCSCEKVAENGLLLTSPESGRLAALTFFFRPLALSAL